MNREERRTGLRFVLRSSGMALLLMLGLVSLSYCWFNLTDTGALEPVGFSAEEKVSACISLYGGTYGHELDLTADEQLFQVPVSGDGISLYRIEGESYEKARPGIDYMETDIMLRVAYSGEILLGEGCSVTPEDLSARISPAGDFSADYIAGAVRVSVTEVTADDDGEEERLLCIWAPNPCFELSCEGGTYSCTDSGTPETEYRCLMEGGTLQSIDVSDSLPISLMSIDTGEEQDIRLRIRLWIEAADRETDAALSGGRFTAGLSLVTRGRENPES